jgi:hypothetical protein
VEGEGSLTNIWDRSNPRLGKGPMVGFDEAGCYR